MRRLFFCILFSFFLFSHNSHKAEAGIELSTVYEVINYALGDGFIKWCCNKIGADDYEDISLTDELTGLFSSNEKNKTCSQNSTIAFATTAALMMIINAVIPGAGLLLQVLMGNILYRASQCLVAFIKKSDALKTSYRYEVCLSSEDDGHPLPMTDRQIAKMLNKADIWPTVENIVKHYNKLCIKNLDTGEYGFYNDGDAFDNVYVQHATGYAYLLCAHIVTACPCVFNIQGGRLADPEYERDESDAIKMRSDGTLIYAGDTETSKSVEEDFKKNYAKHCRLIRFQEVYEQRNDISSIFDSSCFDMHGYSKREANITAGIVQCFEGTARNIFVKPIVSIKSNSQTNRDAYENYKDDLMYISSKYTQINNLLQGRTFENESSGEFPAFLETEINSILDLLKEIWFKEGSTAKVDYVCDENGKSQFNGYSTDLYTKYVGLPARNATPNCCSPDVEISKTCFGDVFNSEQYDNINIKPNLYVNQQTISKASMFEEIEKVEVLMKFIDDQKNLALDSINATMVSNDNFSLTLFDILRNRLKVIATIALVFWVFILGWKGINGDMIKMDVKAFADLALKVFLCYMVVFSESAKNYIFNISIQTAQGIGMAINRVMLEIRQQKDNKYNQVCNSYVKDISNTAVKKTLNPVNANSVKIKTDENKYYYEFNCDGICADKNCSEYYYNIELDESCLKYENVNGENICVKKQCIPYQFECADNATFSCTRFRNDNNELSKQCLKGVCVDSRGTFIAMPPMERPYKIVSYYDRVSGTTKVFTPKCHKKSKYEDQMNYDYTIFDENDPDAERKFSKDLNDYVWGCSDQDINAGYVLDDGYRISEYINHKIVDDSDNSVLIFQSLLPETQQSLDNSIKIPIIKRTPLRTSVATLKKNGIVEEYNFIDSLKASEGFQRAKYRTYIRSLVTSKNKNSYYPKIKQYGETRDYSSVSFWDSMDCKIIQFISMQGYDSGFTEDMESVISGARKNSNIEAVSISALNGLFSLAKMMFMTFPFGILVFALMFGLGAALFMLVARAAQQYCVCVFNLVIAVYLSPFVFVLWLFDQTKGAFDQWLNDMKTNIFGACIPFISVSMFLFIIDWVLFGDSKLYASRALFTSNGAINELCYEGYLSDAPIACLTKRLLKSASIWENILNLFVGGGGFFKADTWKMMGYLLLRALFGAILIISMTSLLDKMEDAVYQLIGGKPDADLGVGFEGKAGDAIKDGASAGVSAGKFGLTAAKTFMKLPLLALGAAAGIIGGLHKNLKTGIDAIKKNVKSGISKVKDSISEGWQRFKTMVSNIMPWNNNKENLDNTINNINYQANNQINNENNRYNQQQANLQNQQNALQQRLNELTNQGNSGVQKNDGKSDQQRFNEAVNKELERRQILAQLGQLENMKRQNEHQHINNINNINASRNNQIRLAQTKYDYGCDDREAAMRNRAEDAGTSYRQITREAEERGTTDVEILYEYETKKYYS